MRHLIFYLLIIFTSLSCSTVKLGYNNADWLLPWIIDNYFELDGQQEEFVEEKIIHHLNWHRYTELPRYNDFIDEATPKIIDGLSSEEYDWVFNEIKFSYNQLIERILPDATELLLSLTPQQIDELENRIMEKNKERSSRPPQTEEERLVKRQDRIIDRMEDWFGYLTKEQIAAIKEMAADFPDNSAMYGADRVRRQKVFLTLLRGKPAKDEFISALRTYFTDYNQGRTPEYIEMSENYWRASKKMTLAIDKLLSSDQKMKAVERLRAYQIDFQDLASVK
jgi:hypothetical protein